MRFVFLIAVALLFSSSYGQDGELDLLFSDDGVITYNISEATEQGMAVVVREDGKILIAGIQNSASIFLLQLNSDGTNDASFGYDGLLFLEDYSMVSNGPGPQFLNMKLQPDNKILIVGSFIHPNNWGVMGLFRLMPDGAVDNTFGVFGEPVSIDLGLDPGIEMLARDLVIEPDGKIVVVANYSAYSAAATWDRPFIKRYHVDGTLDITFNGIGYIVGEDSQRATGIALQDDGKILVSNGDTKVYRYYSNGDIDATFDGDGKVNIYYGTYDQSIIVKPDGKINVGFEYGSYYLHQYNNDGSLDNDFNDAGETTAPISTELRCHATALNPDGKIIIAGYVSGWEDGSIPRVVRINSNGNLDNTFNGIGYADTEFGKFASYFALAVQLDGKIICIGTSYGWDYDYALIIARYNGSVEVGINTNNILFENISISPNPLGGDLSIILNSIASQEIAIELVDLAGKIIFSYVTQVVDGNNSIQLNTENLIAGTYIIKIQSSQQQYAQLLIKK